MESPMLKTSLPLALLLSLSLLSACDNSGTAKNEREEAITKATSSLTEKMTTAIEEAKKEIINKNMSVGSDHGKARGEITPAGDLLINSKPVAVTEEQRRQLVAHREILVKVAISGMEIGLQGVDLAGNVAGDAIKSIFSGDTDQLEKKAETEAKEIEKSAQVLCEQLPLLLESQQKLATSLPEFKPFATMKAEDFEDCHQEVNIR